MVCVQCTIGFFSNGVNIGIILTSIAIALAMLAYVKKHMSLEQKLALLYAHVFALVFPFVYFSLFSGCQQLFSSCNQIDKMLYLLALTGGISLLLAGIVAPVVFTRRYKQSQIDSSNTHAHRFIQALAKENRLLTPTLHIIDKAKPIAFSITYLKASIYISVGLMDLLSKKELEAVLLHEFAHIKYRSSWLRYSLQLVRLVSPLAQFTSFAYALEHEEELADRFAISRQGTATHVHSARKKMQQFFEER